METRAVVGNVADLVKHLVDELLANCVMTTSIVVGRILLSSDHLFRMEKTAIGTGADFIDYVGLEITVDGSGNIFAIACVSRYSQRYYSFVPDHQGRMLTGFGEKGAESLVGIGSFALFGQIAIGLYSS